MRAERQALSEGDLFHLKMALEIGQRGAPIWTFPPNPKYPVDRREFRFPKNWSVRSQSIDEVASRFRPGWALAAGTGVIFDVVDVDPRNGGEATFRSLRALMPVTAGQVATPGGGDHWFIPPAGAGSCRSGGIDYLGRGHFAYLPGTRRPKYGRAGYMWVRPMAKELLDGPASGTVLEHLQAHKARRDQGPQPVPAQSKAEERTGFLSNRAIEHLATTVARARPGERNKALNDAAYEAGQRLGTCKGPHATRILNALEYAAKANGLWQDDPSGVRATVESAMIRGAASTADGVV